MGRGDLERRVATVGLAACVLMILGGLGAVAVFDHPAAALGVGGTSTAELPSLSERSKTFTITATVETEAGSRFAVMLSRRSDGVLIGRYWPHDDHRRNITRVEYVESNGAVFTRVTYETRADVPEETRKRHTVGNDLYVLGSTTENGARIRRVVADSLGDLVVARNGTATRDGESFERYDVVGRDGGRPPAFEERMTRGQLLVEADTRVVRYADVKMDRRGAVIRVRMRANRTAVGIPDWVRAEFGAR